MSFAPKDAVRGGTVSTMQYNLNQLEATMREKHGRTIVSAPLTLALILAAVPAVSGAGLQEPPDTGPELQAAEASGQNCSYRNDPLEAELGAYRARQSAYERVMSFVKGGRTAGRSVAPAEIPRRNLVDDHIFSKLQSAGVQSAAVSRDEVFLRRISLDLAGVIPAANEIRSFVADQDPAKRSKAIDRLLKSPEFVDKWTIWLGDLLGNARVNSNRSLQTSGRNAMHWWMKDALEQGMSFRDIAYLSLVSSGNNYDKHTGGTNFLVRSFHPMGPAQDTYDMMLVRSATAFLGMSHYDCILCHDGRRHLDTISLWGSKAKRAEAQKMAAHFSRTSTRGYVTEDRTEFYANSFYILDARTGVYSLNTTSGNRPGRATAGPDGQAVASYTPVYRTGKAPSGAGTWRESFHAAMVEDELFSINYANRLWKAMFGLGLVDPVDTLDPERLDPNKPPPAPWTLQASHPELLVELAALARAQDFNMREFLRVLAESSAYQLDSAYEGDWDITKANLFARRIPRRIEGEEFHDALMKATGTAPPNGGYTVEGWGDTRVMRAMQLPEPVEPRSNGTVNAFLNTFSRGNRDTVPRSQSGSILLQLNVMNSPLVTERIRISGSAASPFVTAMTKESDNQQVLEELFLTFLSRQPSEYERETALSMLAGKTGASRSAAIEDIAWALVNKLDFMFSY